MASDFISWSYSRLNAFKNCPRMFYHQTILKKWEAGHIPYIESPQQAAGKAIDAALTARISKGVALPPEYAHWEPMCNAVVSASGVKYTQLELAFDRSYKSCGTKDWDVAYLRCGLDLGVLNPDHLRILDWKDGNIKLDKDQLKLFAAAGFLYFPEVETIDTSYVWLKNGVTSDEKYRRRELPDLLAYFQEDVEQLQIAFKTNVWPTKPGKFPCGWCSVNRLGLCKDAAIPPVIQK